MTAVWVLTAIWAAHGMAWAWSLAASEAARPADSRITWEATLMSPYSILSVMKDISVSVLLEVFGWEGTRGRTCPHLPRKGLFRGFGCLGGVAGHLGGLWTFCGNFRKVFSRFVSLRMRPGRG